MINIITSLFPFRLNIKDKSPVELTIQIKNMGLENKFISYDIILDNTISLDKSGLKKSFSIRHGDFKPNEVINQRLYIYPFQGIRPGDNKIIIRVNEHYLDYDSLKQKTDKIIVIKSI